ncbi:MAG TPA: hypothetical protein PLW88_05820, partial [Syntrophorhabdaceae bacterium]|nr:hypothetical protein [Syntrophorhabdaceae bacterium]
MTKDIEIPLEVVILIIGGMALLITGVLLFFVSKGMLPYYENGISGLLLVIFSLQIITLGKTPFGDMPRSVVLLTIGVIIATIGIVACFIPVFVKLPRMLLLLCLGPGGLIMLVR